MTKSSVKAVFDYSIQVTLDCEVEKMKQPYIPEQVKCIVGDSAFTRNGVGMSGSEVLIFPDYVLKIQEYLAEAENERSMVAWLAGRLPVPEIPAYCVEENRAYTLMTRIKGEMLCTEKYLTNPELLTELVAEGLKLLWQVDVTQCPYRTSRLEERLKAARWNVEHNLVDLDNVDPETFGEGGFANPLELLEWLEQNRPEEDIVLTHGDFCLPNIFAVGNKISGFIDLGKLGPADRWQDIAIVMRSLKDNLGGAYTPGRVYGQFEPQMLLEKLGIEMDAEKNRYYLLLDELF